MNGSAIKAALTVLGVSAALLVAPAANADGTTYTWTCVDHNDSWSNASCWDLGAVPGDGDSVVIDSNTPVQNVPAVTLHDLSYSGHGHVDPPDGLAGGITVTGHLSWSGGALNMPLTIGPGATAELTAGAPKSVGGDLSVQGTLTLDSIGDADNGGGLAIEIPRVSSTGYSTLQVAPGGSLISHGSNQIAGASCCSSPHPITLRNDGSISVPSGSLELSALLFDQAHVVDVGSGAGLGVRDGVVRLRPGSTYDGAGTLLLDHDATPSPDPDPDDNQGAVLLGGTVSLGHGFEVALRNRSALTGVGTFTGTGTVQLDHATVYGSVRTGAGVGLEVTGPEASHVANWNGTTGYVGHLTLGGPSTVRPGSELDVDAGGLVTIARGGSLTVPAGARVVGSGSGGNPTLVDAAGGSVRFGSGSGTSAKLSHAVVRNDGSISVLGPTSWDGVDAVQPTGSLTLDSALTSTGSYTFGSGSTLTVGLHGRSAGRLALGGRAKLAGVLRTAGPGSHARGRRLGVIRAAARTGAFGCVRADGWLPAYSRTAVTLTGLGVATPSRCGHAVTPRTRLHKRIGRKAAHFKVPHGRARYVLLEIKLHAPRAARVTIRAKRGGRVALRTHRHKRLHRYVVVRVGASPKFTVRAHHGKARVTVRYLSNYR